MALDKETTDALAALRKEFSDSLAELKADNEKSVKELTKKVEASNKLIEKLSKLVDSKDLTEKVEEKNEKPLTIPTDVFKVGEESFKFNAPQFNIKGHGSITAEAALAKPELLKELVKMGAGVIEKVATAD